MEGVAAAMESFTATCRVCREPFTYMAPGMSLGATVMPLTGPRSVCDGSACTATVALETHNRELSEAEAARRAVLDHAASEFARWVPDRYHAKASPGHAAMVEHIVPELENWHPSQSVYLHGPSGSGKTHQLACMVLVALARGYSVQWWSTRDLIAQAQAAIGSRKRERPAILTDPCACDVLVFDDLFAERPTEYAVTELGNVVSKRYDAGKPIAIAANFTLSEAAALSEDDRVAQELERVSGRLLEMTTPPNGLRHRMDDVNWRVAIARGAGHA